ncbi:MAG: caspase family protein [Bacteroidia bacterium]
MRLYHFFSIPLFLLLFVGINCGALAQTTANLYMFIVIQQDAQDVGAIDDGTSMTALTNDIKTKVPNLNVVVKKMTGEEATTSRIESELSAISNCSNDIIWYYYSGHGRNYDTWPETDEQDVSLTWVHSKLKDKKARLTLAMYDCCTYQEPTTQPPSDLHPKIAFWKPLLFSTKGSYIVSACSSKEFAFGASGAGSIFTNNFIDAFYTKSSWDEIFTTAKNGTISDKPNQHPQWDVQNSSGGGTSREALTDSPVPAPAKYKVRPNDTWEKVVSTMNQTPGLKRQVTVEALKNSYPQYKNNTNPPVGVKLEFHD